MNYSQVSDHVRSLLRDKVATDYRIEEADMLIAISKAVVDISALHPVSCLKRINFTVSRGSNVLSADINELRDIHEIGGVSARKVEFYGSAKVAFGEGDVKYPEYSIPTDQPSVFYASVAGSASGVVTKKQQSLMSTNDEIMIDDTWISPISYMSAGHALMQDADDEENRQLGASFMSMAENNMSGRTQTVESRHFRSPTTRKVSGG